MAKTSITSTTIQNLQELSFNNLKLAKVGRNIKLLNDKQSLNINTNVLYMPFNLNKYKKQWSNIEEYSVDCYVQDNLCNNKLTEFDNAIFDLVKGNSQLFGLSDLNDAVYSPMYRENKSYPKLLKLYLPRDSNGNFTTHFFDSESNKIIINEENIETILTKKTMFKCIITCTKVWCYQNKIGSIWEIVQLKLNENKDKDLNNSDNSDHSDMSDVSDQSDSKGNSNSSNIYTQSLID